jgi:hypothetical protein
VVPRRTDNQQAAAVRESVTLGLNFHRGSIHLRFRAIRLIQWIALIQEIRLVSRALRMLRELDAGSARDWIGLFRSGADRPQSGRFLLQR